MACSYMYILECCDGTYYTGSTKYFRRRIEQHKKGKGARYTARRLPVKLLYYERFSRIDEAFYRECQVKRWSHKKKKALVEGQLDQLNYHAKKKFVANDKLKAKKTGSTPLR
jgi:putative endonuclease